MGNCFSKNKKKTGSSASPNQKKIENTNKQEDSKNEDFQIKNNIQSPNNVSNKEENNSLSLNKSEGAQFYCKKCNALINDFQKEIMKGHGADIIPIPEAIRNQYTFEKTLGKGAFGVVFKVVEKSSMKPFALKIMLIQEENDMTVEENMEYLKKKNDITASLNHKYIVKYFESIVLPECSMMAIKMQLAETSLYSLIQKGLSQEDAKKYIFQICEGLRYLHEDIHVIHRDMKPQNILIVENCVKICDFDTAKQKKSQGGKTTVSMFVGTESYMAPEAINMIAKIDEKVDIWALGIIMHQLLTNGIHPFGTNKEDRLQDILEGKFHLHDSIKDEVMIDLLKGCFAVEPKNRLSISEIMKKIENPSLKLSEIAKEVVRTCTLFRTTKMVNKKKNTFEEIISNFEIFNKENFEVCELIGKGAFSDVYKIYDKTSKRYYSMKNYVSKLNDYEQGDEFYNVNEFVVNNELKKLNHSAFLINCFYKDSQQDKKIISISELGVADMGKVLKFRKNAYSEKETVYILSNLIEGLILAQENHISIQDIKPDNILLFQQEDGKLSYKFFDYGISIILEHGKNYCEAADLQGLTYHYAAPELINISKLNDNEIEKITFDPFKADAFSLGIFILRLIGNSMNAIRTMRKQNFENFSPYMQLDYPNLMPVIKQMLQIDPFQRPGFSHILDHISKLEKTIPDETEVIKFLIEEEKKKQK